MAIQEGYPRTLHTLSTFLNNALHLNPASDNLEGFHYNKELLMAATMNTYVETVGIRSDSLFLAIRNSTLKDVADAYMATSVVITKHVSLRSKNVMLAFDYTEEDFYGELSNLWIHGWTGEHGVTGKFKFLSCNVINDDLMVPLFSIPAQMGNGAAHDIKYIDDQIEKAHIIGPVDLSLFDRGFYCKEVMYELCQRRRPYLIMVPKNETIKREFSLMEIGDMKGIEQCYSFYENSNKREFESYLNFIKGVFDRKTESYLDWCFATNVKDIELDGMIKTYKKRWRIETGFRVQDEANIKTKSVDVRIRYVLFAYEQLLQSLWTLLYKEKGISFKRFLIELSEVCNRLVEKSERKRSA